MGGPVASLLGKISFRISRSSLVVMSFSLEEALGSSESISYFLADALGLIAKENWVMLYGVFTAQ